ncbi:MAG: hypothetical protein ACTHNU_05035 [Gaiellales bacterium]
MQPQWAAYVAQTCQGDPPHAGMAQLLLELSPANAVFGLANVAVKNADVRSGLQVVERQFGTLELHGRDPVAVRGAGAAVLERAGLDAAQRVPPQIVSDEVITRVHPNQAQLVNRMRVASLLLQDETMFLLEVTPAAYVAAAANEAERRSPVKLVYAAILGASGRLIMSGRDAEVAEGHRAAREALAGHA